MDQRAFVFAARGHCIKGNNASTLQLKNKICVCVKNNLTYFPFIRWPLVANRKVGWSIGPIQLFISFY